MLADLDALNLTVAAHLTVQAGAALRVLARPNIEPPTRAAWLILILSVPFLGVGLYLLTGEVRLNQRIARRLRATMATLSAPETSAPEAMAALEAPFRPAFARAASVNGFAVRLGNRATLLPEAEAQIAALLADIAAARESVHLTTYIWLTDATGTRVAEALAEAARRGVTVRALVDGLGGRGFIGSAPWHEMKAAGVRLGVAFPFRWWLFKLATSRIDLRNHRKLVVIDGRVAYTGSRNLADPEFRIKARFAPWTDVLIRLEGPVAVQHQRVFATDWGAHTGESLASLLAPTPEAEGAQALAVTFATGPLLDPRGVPDVFLATIGAASQSLTLTTPYFVPGEEICAALRAAALRGVAVRLIVPRVNDSRFVALASRASYAALIAAGVEIFEHAPGLLHAKTLLADGAVALVGSANLDRRSFTLNYENCLLVQDAGLCADLAALQAQWVAQSRHMSAEALARWSRPRKLAMNLISIMAPVL